MIPRRASLLQLVTVTLALGSCRDPMFMRSIDGEFAALFIHGTVRTPDGAPAAGVTVRVEARVFPACATWRDRDAATTDANGRYSAMIGNWGQPFDTCLRAWAEPPAGAAFGADSTTRDSVRVGGASPDSLQLDFSLPPGA
jgi:hypothetical protein